MNGSKEEVPCLFPDLGGGGSTREEYEAVDFDAITASHLEHCSSVYNAPQDMILMAVWALVVRKYTGGDQQRFAALTEEPGEFRGAMYRVALDDQMAFKELTQPDSWEVSLYDEGDSSYNTALILRSGQDPLSGFEGYLPSVTVSVSKTARVFTTHWLTNILSRL